jgi:hypothetical protein
MEKRIRLGKNTEREGVVQIKVILIEICGLFAPFRWFTNEISKKPNHFRN